VAKKTFFLTALLGVILLGCSSTAASLPEFTAPVVDSIGRVSADVETQIISELTTFLQTGGPQIAVAVVDTTGSASLENYSTDLARSWGIGDNEKDNGVLMLIALKDRGLRIEVGSGVEGELTDTTAGRIVDSVMLPRLRANDVDGAVREGVRAVMQVWRGEGIAPQPIVPNTPATESATQQSPFGIALFFGLILLFLALAVSGKIRGGGLLGPFGGGTIYGGDAGNHPGGFGGGFGGFSGGGGGDFSGGGASGSW
jgi:uncharacterized protein